MRFEFVMTKCFRWRYKLTEALINFCQPATSKIPSTFIVRSFYEEMKLTCNEDIHLRVLSPELFVTRVTLSLLEDLGDIYLSFPCLNKSLASD
jgi:hypothetical protein